MIPAVFSGSAILRLVAVESRARQKLDELILGGSLVHRALMIAASGACVTISWDQWSKAALWENLALLMLSMLLSLLLVGAGAWVNDHRPWTRTPAPVSPVATAAEPDAPRPARKKAAAGDVLTNKTVIGMVKANMAAPLIVSRIRSSKTNFNLSAPEIVRLGQAGVPEQVMDAMHNPKPAAKSNRQP